MRFWLLGFPVLALLLTVMAAQAEIYTWVDSQGVKHYSNTPPPADAQVLDRREEKAHDAEAHARRMAAEQEALKVRRAAEAQQAREAQERALMEQQLAAQREAAEAALRAEAAAERAADAAERSKSSSSGYILYPHRPPGHWRPRPHPSPYGSTNIKGPHGHRPHSTKPRPAPPPQNNHRPRPLPARPGHMVWGL